MNTQSDSRICADCGRLCITGYGTTPTGERVCGGCCGVRDRQTMIVDGHSRRLPLYLTDGGVTNWPGTLRFRITDSRIGRHNIAGTRTDVWFDGPDGHVWHGVQYGEWTQVCHTRRNEGALRQK